MNDVVIYVEGLSKRYDLGEIKDYRLLGDLLFGRHKKKKREVIEDPRMSAEELQTAAAKADARAAEIAQLPLEERYLVSEKAVHDGKSLDDRSKVLWALRDVSFEVPHGEIIGIIGRNGAGKSTLLKIISKITSPTEGRVQISGRVGSLLEIGTGFHPELTGRENIFMNGAISGMSKKEIEARYEEIVEFSEVGRFIDTPVKRYSSGMFTRLAFAVSAHLDPEILIIDEVLSVGDAAFQKKCMRKMERLMKSGRTVLFVSHSMSTVAELCTHAILLKEGQVLHQGKTTDVIAAYARQLGGEAKPVVFEAKDQQEFKGAAIRQVTIANAGGAASNFFDISEEIVINVKYDVLQTTDGLQLALVLSRNMSEIMQTFDTDSGDERLPSREPGTYISTLRLPAKFFKAGGYTGSLAIGTPEALFELVEGAVQFQIGELSEVAKHRGYRKERLGHIICPGAWSIEKSG